VIRSKRRGHSIAAAAALCSCALLGACGGGGGGEKASSTTTPGSTTSLPTAPAKPPTKKQTAELQAKNDRSFDRGNFGSNPARGATKFQPTKPGLQLVSEGHLNRGHRQLVHRRVLTVTDVTKKIDGVRAVATLDQDFDGGQLAEQAIDWVAESKTGTLWYLGSYTEAYEGGQFVNATDGWLAGINTAKPGILMPGDPHVGLSVLQATFPGEYPTPAEVIKMGVKKCVPFKCYKGVAVIQEGGGDGGEWKYFAPGVGQILTEPKYSGGEQETELLVNATELSSKGLAEISDEVLKVDRHAAQVIPSVFGQAGRAKRTL
jgi:hypothetical protein